LEYFRKENMGMIARLKQTKEALGKKQRLVEDKVQKVGGR
jgi:hypothetical protein